MSNYFDHLLYFWQVKDVYRGLYLVIVEDNAYSYRKFRQFTEPGSPTSKGSKPQDPSNTSPGAANPRAKARPKKTRRPASADRTARAANFRRDLEAP